MLLAVGLTLLGYGLGLLIRNTPATICILLLWPLIAEGLIAGLLSVAGAEECARFLPVLGRVQHGGRPTPIRDACRPASPAAVYFFAVGRSRLGSSDLPSRRLTRQPAATRVALG